MKIRATLNLRNEKMIAAREKTGLTQAQAAELAGVNLSFYTELERLDYSKLNLKFKGSQRNITQRIESVAMALTLDAEDVAPEELRGTKIEVSHRRIAEMDNTALISLNEMKQIASPIDVENQKDIARYVSAVIKTLPFREQEIVKQRFGIDGEKPLEFAEIGKKLNITRERVRQLECRAIRNLQHPARMEKLSSLLDEKEPSAVTTPAREWVETGNRKKCNHAIGESK